MRPRHDTSSRGDGAEPRLQGAAATIRFDDGALEVEYAADRGVEMALPRLDRHDGGELISRLPDDTVARDRPRLLRGLVRQDGRLRRPTLAAAERTTEELMAEIEPRRPAWTFPDDRGARRRRVAVSMGADLDLDASSTAGPGEPPVGVTIQGDPDEIEGVLDKIKAQRGRTPRLLETEVRGRRVAIAPTRTTAAPSGRRRPRRHGAFDEVVEDADEASAVLFVDFDADDNWLVAACRRGRPEVGENIEPLSAFGITGWLDDDVVARRRQADHRLSPSPADRGRGRPGDRDQVGRCQLQVEPAPPARDEDRRERGRGRVEHGG